MTAALERAQTDELRGMVAKRLGLEYADDKLDFLGQVARQRIDATGCSDFDSYMGVLNFSARREDELRALAEQLTVTETFFFRNADQFRALTEAVIPERIRARRHHRRLCVLSAGCASGEEPFSLAIALRETLPDLRLWEIEIRAVDVNPAMLAKAGEAQYSSWSLRATPEEIKSRYFRAQGRGYVLDPSVRQMVAFEERNLAAADSRFWKSLDCDAVFCRNVLMYFTPEVMQRTLGGIGEALLPGGFLFLGHAETLRGLSHDYHLRHTHDTFYYQRRDAAELRSLARIAAPPRETQSLTALPAALEAADSWVDAIQRASERIAELTGKGTGLRAPASAASPSTPHGSNGGRSARSFELAAVLDLMRQERFADALELLRTLPAESSVDPDALLLGCVLLTNNGKLKDAEAACRALLDVDELNAGAHYLTALCREHVGDRAGATDHDQTAAYLDSSFAMPRLHLGLLAKRAGDRATARRELGQALILLGREDASRLLLFGGGFSREALTALCRAELSAMGAEP